MGIRYISKPYSVSFTPNTDEMFVMQARKQDDSYWIDLAIFTIKGRMSQNMYAVKPGSQQWMIKPMPDIGPMVAAMCIRR